MKPLELTLRVIGAIGDVPAHDWDACANTTSDKNETSAQASEGEALKGDAAPLGNETTSGARPYNPFISHAFLSAAEKSGSARIRTGWQPMHVIAEDASGRLLGACPCYAKSHSQGEYIFDHGWADAYERAGGNYYPKLLVAAPFTPAGGRRLLVRPGPHANVVEGALADGLAQICQRSNASSVHVNFLTEGEWDLLGHRDYLKRTHRQFHWENPGYASFDDFLATLASRKRKTIRRERQDALKDGISIEWLTGPDLTESVWDTFFEFYTDTGSRKWGQPYLTRQFYSLVGQTMADRVLLVLAKRDGRYIAGAINFIGSDTLFGRHWGCIEQHQFLHFEVCYYQAMDYAIAHKLRVEAGAGGEHKISRGYCPMTTYSAHYIADPNFRRAIESYLNRERAYVAAEVDELAEATPFRKGG